MPIATAARMLGRRRRRRAAKGLKKRRSASPETIELLDSDSDSDEKAKVEKSPEGGDDGEDSDDVSDEAEQRRRDWRIAHGDSPRDAQELYEFRRAKFERARRSRGQRPAERYEVDGVQFYRRAPGDPLDE
mgnify:CR=1 FL=1